MRWQLDRWAVMMTSLSVFLRGFVKGLPAKQGAVLEATQGPAVLSALTAPSGPPEHPGQRLAGHRMRLAAAGDQRLLDLLSEMLAVERDGERLYTQFLSDAPEDLREKLLEYAEQSRRSALVLEQAVRGLGGNPAYVSPGAEVVHRLTEAALAATEPFPGRTWMYRLLHLVAYEVRDRVVWELLDALADKEGGHTGEVLRTAATAILSEEAWGAHMADRNEERISWAAVAMQRELGREFGVEVRTGRRRGLHRPR